METSERVGHIKALGGSFDPTYKGWKPHPFVAVIKIVETRFDPTYKGWKPISETLYFDCGAGFDPTYKGWKRGTNWW